MNGIQLRESPNLKRIKYHNTQSFAYLVSLLIVNSESLLIPSGLFPRAFLMAYMIASSSPIWFDCFFLDTRIAMFRGSSSDHCGLESIYERSHVLLLFSFHPRVRPLRSIPSEPLFNDAERRRHLVCDKPAILFLQSQVSELATFEFHALIALFPTPGP